MPPISTPIPISEPRSSARRRSDGRPCAGQQPSTGVKTPLSGSGTEEHPPVRGSIRSPPHHRSFPFLAPWITNLDRGLQVLTPLTRSIIIDESCSRPRITWVW